MASQPISIKKLFGSSGSLSDILRARKGNKVTPTEEGRSTAPVASDNSKNTMTSAQGTKTQDPSLLATAKSTIQDMLGNSTSTTTGSEEATSKEDVAKPASVEADVPPPITINLTFSLGDLKDKKDIEALPEDTKILITTLSKIINKIDAGDRTYETTLAAISSNPLIEPVGTPVFRNDILTKKSTNAFKFDGSPDPEIVEEVRYWYEKLVGDPEILKALDFDTDTFAGIVAQTGATVEDAKSVIHKVEQHTTKPVDIAVLQYPDSKHGYAKLYHLVLEAWSRSERVLGVQEDSNGIRGSLNVREFKERSTILAGLSAGAREKAAAEAVNLLDG